MKEIILKQYDSEVKTIEGERALNVIITTNDVDRSGDIVEPKGAKLVNFRKNPVVLMSHDYSGLPIGKATELTRGENGITAKVIFPAEGVYPLADTVYNLYKGKFMKAWSIGFIPIKSEDIVDEDKEKKGMFGGGRRYKTWELLEFSACSVPNNPFALNNMVQKGIDIGLLKNEGLIKIVKDIDFEKVEDPDPEDKTEEIKAMAKEGLKDVKIDPIDPEKETKEEYLEEIELFESMATRFLPMYLVEHKQRIISEALHNDIKDLELKAGAVLNAANKGNLKKSLELIQSVLDSATSEESQEGSQVKDTKKDDTVITLTTDKKEDPGKVEATKEKTITVDEIVIAKVIDKAVKFQLGITEK